MTSQKTTLCGRGSGDASPYRPSKRKRWASSAALSWRRRWAAASRVAKASSGHRRYTDDDLGWVRYVQLLRATGMPIREVKEFVTLTWAGDHTIPQRVEVLAAYRAALVERMASDVGHLAALNRKLDYYEGVLAARDATPEDVTGEPSVRR